MDFVAQKDEELIYVQESFVVGDVVEIEAGRTIPADLRIIESVNLKMPTSINFTAN